MSHQIWAVLLYDRIVVTATMICHGSGFTHFGLLQTLLIAHECVVHHVAKLWLSNRTTAFGILSFQMYSLAVALCTLSKPINNNKKCDLSALDGMIG
jgi:hypothetical protein